MSAHLDRAMRRLTGYGPEQEKRRYMVRVTKSHEEVQDAKPVTIQDSRTFETTGPRHVYRTLKTGGRITVNLIIGTTEGSVTKPFRIRRTDVVPCTTGGSSPQIQSIVICLADCEKKVGCKALIKKLTELQTVRRG